jgi:hypothetical protein
VLSIEVAALSAISWTYLEVPVPMSGLDALSVRGIALGNIIIMIIL